MVTVDTYKYNGEHNRIIKELGNPLTINGVFHADFDIRRPRIIVTGKIDFNYLYIHEWDAFYFVEGITILDTFKTRLELKKDVLMTFQSEILQARAYSNACDNNTYLNTTPVIYDVRTKFKRINGQKGFNENGNIILVTIKG